MMATLISRLALPYHRYTNMHSADNSKNVNDTQAGELDRSERNPARIPPNTPPKSMTEEYEAASSPMDGKT